MPALVQLMDLICHRTEDNGDDEIYFILNGERVYGGEDGAAISQGQTRDLRSIVKPVRGTTHLALFDEDWPDSDDALGVHAITESEAGLGVRTAVFDWDDARYTLTYRVERDPFG
ncbi:hypothetical protein [Rhodococcus rhodochrous]|uniref:Uncharacterized protein n=1 Tax=Rhodococcus rhodochrous KG-21 TaxID=1441923 RepID=A0A0M8PQE6_RHORH|nr:hypothetical protein [Rhodococcus rhodochrous]KOS57402.1 hypothetical protein Z051_04915 [Rhodococcus rhodochrous KG-21]